MLRETDAREREGKITAKRHTFVKQANELKIEEKMGISFVRTE
jgi:hypothetical protein